MATWRNTGKEPVTLAYEDETGEPASLIVGPGATVSTDPDQPVGAKIARAAGKSRSLKVEA